MKEKAGNIIGCDAYSPASVEPSHVDLFWYGIHGVEILFTAMGKGCSKVQRTFSKDTDLVVGTWEDGRIGTFRGKRNGKHDYGGTAHGEKATISLGPYSGYKNLVVEILQFFKTKKPPVDASETLEIYAFMEAADRSKENGGKEIDMKPLLKEI